MKKNNLIMSALIIASMAIVICSCKKDSDWVSTPPSEFPNPTELLPMAVGNYWVFDAWDYAPTYTKIDSTHSTDSLVVVGSAQIEGRSAWIVEHYSDSGLKDSLFFQVTETGIYRYLTVHDTMPAEYGPRWVSVYSKDDETVTDCLDKYSAVRQFFDTTLVAQIMFTTQSSKNFDSTVVLAGKEYQTIQLKQTVQYSEIFNDSVLTTDSILKYFKVNKFFNSATYYSFYPKIGFMAIKKAPHIRGYQNLSGNYRGIIGWNEFFKGKLYSLLRYRLK